MRLQRGSPSCEEGIQHQEIWPHLVRVKPTARQMYCFPEATECQELMKRSGPMTGSKRGRKVRDPGSVRCGQCPRTQILQGSSQRPSCVLIWQENWLLTKPVQTEVQRRERIWSGTSAWRWRQWKGQLGKAGEEESQGSWAGSPKHT